MCFSSERTVDIYEMGIVILLKEHNSPICNLFYIINFDNIVL